MSGTNLVVENFWPFGQKNGTPMGTAVRQNREKKSAHLCLSSQINQFLDKNIVKTITLFVLEFCGRENKS